MKRAFLIIAAAVVAGCWIWIGFFSRTTQSAPAASMPPVPSTTPIATPSTTAVPKVDIQSAKRSAEIVLREFFTLSSVNSGQDLRQYAVDALIEELRDRQAQGMLPGLSVKVGSVVIVEDDLPHISGEIILSATVAWKVLVDGEATEHHTSYVVVNLVHHETWQVANIDELNDASELGG